ncbi:hypothetical protein E4T66_12100 [Sinimarinibacterium sp. CAU 1509]|uniref:hypothetical protein n=1 Tax=Sinimarinibacterium sp. CAU 1509 TaxID=2562283 RepID=UPI0010AC6FC6|nr:hypothetical protein [Sinimarinibacterium sp. CAU 1509]TJY59918.1 hypothetical protein E4T66_12100 [Sinimarinibacterium sp. CAU 1509]
MKRSIFAALLTMLLCACGNSSADPAGSESQSSAATGPATLRLSAQGTTGEFIGEPACKIVFQVENRGELKLAVFATNLVASDTRTGAALKTVSLPRVGIVGDTLDVGATSKPWPLNVQGAACEFVDVGFEKLKCAFAGKPCGAIEVSQQGLAGIRAPKP